MAPPIESIDRLRADPTRVRAVLATGLLDAPPDDSFDRLTALGARLIKAPAAFLSLVDAERDFYVSHHGFEEPLASERMLAGRTFCHHTLGRSEPLVIEDALADPAFATVPTIETLGVRAYLGVPLQDDAGQSLGSFCAIDFEPRVWTKDEIALFEELARSCLREIQLRKALELARRSAHTEERLRCRTVRELRHPLTAMECFTRLLEGGKADEDAIRGLRCAVDLLGASLGHLARHSAPAEPTSRRRPAELVRDTVVMMGPEAAERGVALVIEEEPTDVDDAVDTRLVLRVLAHLVENAVSVSRPGSTVRVYGRGLGGSLEISVVDEARTSPADAEWSVSWGDPRARSVGLSSLRELLEANGGSVWVERSAEHGTTVGFRVPLAH
ncbi:MAG: hypothetical protein CMN30_01205 [Sandaracinus sp.]|nr:hypothetical protein [Sandaracinus sp.]|tara:strand:+ start:1968 stop:3125 length:1158 start_codon:yes stop_codon:yes gene_type:complete